MEETLNANFLEMTWCKNLFIFVRKNIQEILFHNAIQNTWKRGSKMLLEKSCLVCDWIYENLFCGRVKKKTRYFCHIFNFYCCFMYFFIIFLAHILLLLDIYTIIMYSIFLIFFSKQVFSWNIYFWNIINSKQLLFSLKT